MRQTSAGYLQSVVHKRQLTLSWQRPTVTTHKTTARDSIQTAKSHRGTNSTTFVNPISQNVESRAPQWMPGTTVQTRNVPAVPSVCRQLSTCVTITNRANAYTGFKYELPLLHTTRIFITRFDYSTMEISENTVLITRVHSEYGAIQRMVQRPRDMQCRKKQIDFCITREF
jgi:hypothetical protein